jgi:hypothetical protein
MLRRVASALLVAVALVLAAAAAPAAGSAPVSGAALPAVPDGSLVFLGVGGLRWSDVNATDTPTLFELTRHSALGALAVRTTEADACPIDGWLTLNGGARAGGPRRGGRCADLPMPVQDNGRTTVPEMASLIAATEHGSADPHWGLLGRPTGARDCAVGPGAALALADRSGQVPADWVPDISRLADLGPLAHPGPRAQVADACHRMFVDGGSLPESAGRGPAVRALDAIVGRLADLGPDSLVVAGISDSSPGHPHLTLAMVSSEQRRAGSTWWRSPSTRQTGLGQITDLTPTLLQADQLDLPGERLELHASGHPGLRDVRALEIRAATVHDDFVLFFVVFIAGEILSFAALAWAWHRRRLSRSAAGGAALQIGLLFGAVAPASFLANALPWARTGHPGVVLWGATAGFALMLALAAFPLRARPAAPAALLGAVTLVLLAADVATGSRLQLDAVFGLATLVAGRFYGFGNIAFAVFAMATLIVAAALGGALVRRGRRRAAAVSIAAIGGFAVLVDGAPGLGTDFGGVLALLPGTVLLAALLLDRRVSVGRVIAVAVLAVVAVSALAIADWTRPAADRSHLGRFVQQVRDGDGGHVIAHKAAANLGLLHNPVIVAVALPLLVVVTTALVRPGALKLHALARAQQQDPALRALLVAALVTGLLGFALNDSGVIVPAVALFTGGPLIATVWAQRWTETA